VSAAAGLTFADDLNGDVDGIDGEVRAGSVG